jgi:hypothetical protein
MIRCGRPAIDNHRNELLMTHCIDDVQIDRAHSFAICREIGERLGMSLQAEQGPLPPRLSSLMQRLAAEDGRTARPKHH